MNLNDRLDALMETICRTSFMQNRGLGNEIGYYIFDYDAKDEWFVREWISATMNRARKNELLVSICQVDVFETMLGLIREKQYLDKFFIMEQQKGSDSVIEPLRRVLRLNDKQNNLLVGKILKEIKPDDILFLTGIGKAYPAIRSHGLLNELHACIDKNPVLLFFPGEYIDGRFTPFGKVSSENYYRAFKI